MKKMHIDGIVARMTAVLLALLVAGASFGGMKNTVSASEVTAMSAQSGTIKGDTVNTRSGAGTNYDKVTSLSGGTEVTVTGQATDSESRVWYQITLSDGRSVFVLSDYLELGEVLEEEGTETPETEEPVYEEESGDDSSSESAVTAPIVSDQYVALYEEDNEGTYYWFLHNNDDGYRVKIDDLLDAAHSVDEVESIQKQNKTLRTALIVLGVVVVILVVILILLILRLRDYMYYEEEEEEDEEEEEEPRRGSFFKRRRDEDLLEDEEEPARQQQGRASRADAARGRGGRDYAEEQANRSSSARASRQTQEDPRAAQRASAAQRPRESEQTRRARNIMKEDDDLEYEFLNLDDK